MGIFDFSVTYHLSSHLPVSRRRHRIKLPFVALNHNQYSSMNSQLYSKKKIWRRRFHTPFYIIFSKLRNTLLKVTTQAWSRRKPPWLEGQGNRLISAPHPASVTNTDFNLFAFVSRMAIHPAVAAWWMMPVSRPWWSSRPNKPSSRRPAARQMVSE